MTQENIAVYPPDLTLVECPDPSQGQVLMLTRR
jgi:hypothetical protein